MSDRDDKISQIERLRKQKQVDELRQQENDYNYRQANGVLQKMGDKALDMAGTVSNKIDQGLPWGAPARAAIGAMQDDKPAGEAYLNQYLQDSSTAPSGKDIAAKAGVSTEEFDLPLIKNPFTREHYKASPAGLIGGAGEALLDPTTYAGFGEAKALEKGGQLLEKVAPKAEEAVGNFAKERAVKAATGESKRDIKKLAKVEGKNPGDVQKALGNLRKTGAALLEKDEAGPPAVGWLSNAATVGENAGAKRKFYGRQIGDIGDTVEKTNPKGIIGADLAGEMKAYADTIPKVGKGAALRARLAEEAKNFEELGPMTFKQAQDIKGQFPYEPQAADVLISDKDVRNKIHGIVGNSMDKAVAKSASSSRKAKLTGMGLTTEIAEEDGKYHAVAKDASGNTVGRVSGFKDPNGKLVVTHANTAPDFQKSGIASSLIDDLKGKSAAKEVNFDKDLTEAGQALKDSYSKGTPLEQEYAANKKKYGIYKDVESAGANQAMNTLNRRMVSPSSHAMGLGMALNKAGDLGTKGLWGAATSAANQLLLSRGSAFAARSADAISKIIQAAPAKYQKWLPKLQTAAKAGNAALLTAHHELMNNDPTYRKSMFHDYRPQAEEQTP